MKNILLPRPDYQFFRAWLRTTQVVWRDVGDSSIVPLWGESVCNESVCVDGRTPGEIAYSELRRVYPILKLQWRKNELDLLKQRPPKLFSGPYRGEVYGLDIKHAYCQIYRKLFLHADWPRKRLKYPLVEVANSLDDIKEARNAIVGIARSTRNKWVQGEKVWYVNKKNPFLSPVLWGHIMSILSEAAGIALKEGAIHINTDGYAFTSEKQRNIVRDRLEDFGVVTKQFSGYGAILGISALCVPPFKQPLEVNVSKPLLHLEPVEAGWLEWWSKLSQ